MYRLYGFQFDLYNDNFAFLAPVCEIVISRTDVVVNASLDSQQNPLVRGRRVIQLVVHGSFLLPNKVVMLSFRTCSFSETPEIK